MKLLVAALALLLVAACTTPQGGPTTGSGSKRIGVAFAPDAGGLAVVGRIQRIDFGRAPPGVKAVLTRETSIKPRSLPIAGCPRGVMERLQWGDLTLVFSMQQFVGWQTSSGAAGVVCR